MTRTPGLRTGLNIHGVRFEAAHEFAITIVRRAVQTHHCEASPPVA
jgi:hypothetical protein